MNVRELVAEVERLQAMAEEDKAAMLCGELEWRPITKGEIDALVAEAPRMADAQAATMEAISETDD